MDTSKEYILMCEKALPDMGGWGYNDGDFCVRKGRVYVWNHVHAERNGWGTGEKCIPLFRQDQLQEIARHHKEGWYDTREINNLCLFWNWWRRVELSSYCHADEVTMEQLWLAFVMKEKFNKKWNGLNWVTP